MATQGSTSLINVVYDNQGRRSGFGRAGGDASGYAYDPASRLQTLSDTFRGSSGNVNLNFSYNPASQIISRTLNNDLYAYREAYNVSRPYAANGLNQYSTAGPATFSYDANGNLTSDGTTNFVYDAGPKATPDGR